MGNSGVFSVGCLSSSRSVGMTEPLLELKLCFLSDLWWLWGVGRSVCDYCLHTDLYLTFNYLRGVCASPLPIRPFFWERVSERAGVEASLVSTSAAGSSLPLAAPQSSPEKLSPSLWNSYPVWDLREALWKYEAAVHWTCNCGTTLPGSL